MSVTTLFVSVSEKLRSKLVHPLWPETTKTSGCVALVLAEIVISSKVSHQLIIFLQEKEY